MKTQVTMYFVEILMKAANYTGTFEKFEEKELQILDARLFLALQLPNVPTTLLLQATQTYDRLQNEFEDRARRAS